MILGGTGHRPNRLGNQYDPMLWRPGIVEIAAILREEYELCGRPMKVISGMALGFDLMVGVAALVLKKEGLPIELWCFIPFAGQTRKWTRDQTILWSDVRSKASRVECMNGSYELGQQDIFVVMHERNMAIANESDALLACIRDKNSGTGDTVTYFEQHYPAKRVRNCYVEVATAMGVPVKHTPKQLGLGLYPPHVEDLKRDGTPRV